MKGGDEGDQTAEKEAEGMRRKGEESGGESEGGVGGGDHHRGAGSNAGSTGPRAGAGAHCGGGTPSAAAAGHATCTGATQVKWKRELVALGMGHGTHLGVRVCMCPRELWCVSASAREAIQPLRLLWLPNLLLERRGRSSRSDSADLSNATFGITSTSSGLASTSGLGSSIQQPDNGSNIPEPHRPRPQNVDVDDDSLIEELHQSAGGPITLNIAFAIALEILHLVSIC